MAGPGFIDHIGIGVPDPDAAKQYYDELMAILGLRAWFPRGADGSFNYGPDGARGPQVFFYRSVEEGANSHQRAGMQHLAFMVQSRAVVREAHAWAVDKGAEILHAPREFPEYGTGYRTYWLDPHGFMIEVAAYTPED